jgi:hypothetical protein
VVGSLAIAITFFLFTPQILGLLCLGTRHGVEPSVFDLSHKKMSLTPLRDAYEVLGTREMITHQQVERMISFIAQAMQTKGFAVISTRLGFHNERWFRIRPDPQQTHKISEKQWNMVLNRLHEFHYDVFSVPEENKVFVTLPSPAL